MLMDKCAFLSLVFMDGEHTWKYAEKSRLLIGILLFYLI